MKQGLAMFERYEAYKDSGVEWLGEIPADWIIMRLKFLCSIKTGERNTEDKVEDGLYPFFVRSQTPEKINSYSYDGEAILTAGDGAGVGKVYHYINGKFDYHQRVYKFSDFNKVDGYFLYRYMEANFHYIANLGTAKSTVDSLRLPLIQDFLVAFPVNPKHRTQINQFTTGKISKIDQSIVVKQQQIELLKERKQIIIQQAVTKGLNPNVPMKDSGIEWIGEIPEHWGIDKFKYLFSQSRLPVNKNDGVVTAFRDGQVTLRTNRRIEGFTEAILEQGYQGIKQGQLVVNSMDAFEGAIGISDSNGKCTPEYVVCDPYSSQCSVYYFALLLREMALARYLQVVSNAVRQRAIRIRYNNLARELMIIPPRTEQDQIVSYIETQSQKIDTAIQLYQQQIEKLQEYKTTLINHAVTGKIKVPEMH